MNSERTCIGCGTKRHKARMLRVSRSPEGEVSVDLTRNAPGRGAYVCSPECIEKVEASGRLSSALRTRVPAEIYGDMAARMKDMAASLELKGKE